VETPILIVNGKYHGDKGWLKGLLCWGLLAVCTLLSAVLGHNVTFAMVIPILCTLRYCDAKFTRHTAIASIALLFVAALGNAFFGIVNLNIFETKGLFTITFTGKLRNSLNLSNIDHWLYFKTSVINDLLPKLMAFSVIGFACIRISEKGRDLTTMQDKVSKKTQRLETELNLANEIQASMLPCIFPAFPCHKELDLYAVNHPAKEVGGDFYDYFKIDDDHIAVVMADVSGKGVGAALFMTISKIVLKTQLINTKDPAAALTLTNKQLCENNTAELFVTVWAGIYDIPARTMTYTNAGHNPPIIIRKGDSAVYLKGRANLVLAGMDGTKYTSSTVKLEDGDEIFLYTDGVTEANNQAEELFGEDRLLQLMEEQRDKDATQQVNNVLAALEEYMNGAEQFDDITAMAMRIK